MELPAPGAQLCSHRAVRSFTDRLWFAAGHYVVALVYIAGARNEAKGPAPVALPLERRLIALLNNRAQAGQDVIDEPELPRSMACK